MLNPKAIFSRLPRCRIHALLILLVWQGPVPICHAHGTLATDTLNAPELVGHLASAHADLSPTADVFFDWHWHWVLPCELATHHDSSQHEKGSHIPGSHDCVGLGESLIILSAENIADISWGDVSQILPECRYASDDLASIRKTGLPTRFLQTFAAELSLPQRLGVHRC